MNANDFRAEFRCRLERNADRVVLRICLPASTTVELTGKQLLTQAVELAQQFSPVAAGSVVLLLLPHSVELFLLQIGLVLTQRVPAILAWPTSRVDLAKYQRNLLFQLQNLPAQQLITLPALAENLSAGLSYKVTGCTVETAERWDSYFRQLTLETSPPTVLVSPTLPEALFLQFSGGTTGAQKAVAITGEMLSAQLARLSETLQFTAHDSVVSWLPMYHDMGLIACLWQPLWQGAPSLQMAASEWLMNPSLLFESIERYQGTFVWLPNFAFSYLAAQKERMQNASSLRSMRGWINCSEPVRLASMRTFATAYADWGVEERTLQACYAMAENVFAVTQTKLGEFPATFSRAAVVDNRRSNALAFALGDEVYLSSGAPVPGMRVRVVCDGVECREAQAGEIQLRTESLFAGYWGAQGNNASSFTSDHWYSTGDYGFLAAGELYIIGRLKDIIIVGGQNVFPEDIESVVNNLPSVYTGRVVAFGLPDAETATESVTIVAEMRGDYDRDRAMRLEREIHKVVYSTISVAPRRVLVVPQRWIVKSTAGKISRIETRARYLQEHGNHSLGAGGHATQ